MYIHTYIHAYILIYTHTNTHTHIRTGLAYPVYGIRYGLDVPMFESRQDQNVFLFLLRPALDPT